MKTCFLATYKKTNGTYGNSLVPRDIETKAEEHIKDYEIASIRIADEWEVMDYRNRGMPVVELLYQQTPNTLDKPAKAHD